MEFGFSRHPRERLWIHRIAYIWILAATCTAAFIMLLLGTLGLLGPSGFHEPQVSSRIPQLTKHENYRDLVPVADEFFIPQ